MTDEKPKKHRWLIWVTILSILVFLISPLVLYRFRNRAVFNCMVKELAADGYPVSLDDLEAAYVLPDGVANAADVYQRAFLLYVEPNSTEQEMLPIRGNYIPQDDQPPYPEEVMRTVRQSLEKNSECLKLLDKAARMEYCLFPRTRTKWGFESADLLSPIRKAAQILTERNLYLAQTGQTDALFESTQTCIGLTNSLCQPLLIDHLIIMGIRAMIAADLEDSINLTNFSEAQLSQLQQDFRSMLENDSYTKAMINERTLQLSYGQMSASDLMTGFSVTSLQDQACFWLYWASGLIEKDAVLSMDFRKRYIDITTMPLHEQLPELRAMQKEIESYSWFHYGLHLTSPSWRIGEIHLRVMGNLQCAETALAVERYRLKYNALPESLDALVPEFMEAVSRDPFDGKPLRYIRNSSGGYTVYIIGEDGIDNGGLDREYDYTFTIHH